MYSYSQGNCIDLYLFQETLGRGVIIAPFVGQIQLTLFIDTGMYVRHELSNGRLHIILLKKITKSTNYRNAAKVLLKLRDKMQQDNI